MFNIQANDILHSYYLPTGRNIIGYPHWLQEMVASYNDLGIPSNALGYDHLPEHYYGNTVVQPFAVFLSHNPGGSQPLQHFMAHTANNAWYVAAPIHSDYHNIASVPAFPLLATHRFINNINNQIDNICSGRLVINSFRMFIKDLLPFHSTNFGTIDFGVNTTTWNKHFLTPVLDIVDNSFISSNQYSNAYGKNAAKNIIFARGKAFLNMAPLGFRYLGRIASNIRVFKLDRDKPYYMLVFTKAKMQYFPIKQISPSGNIIFPTFNALQENAMPYIHDYNNEGNLNEILEIIEYLS